MSDNQGNGIIAGFLLGAVVGAGIALLVAPASGRDTRRRIKEKADAIRGPVGELTDDTRDRLDALSQTMRDGARDLAGVVTEGREAYRRAVDETATASKRA